MFVVQDQNGEVLGCCENISDINNIEFVHFDALPYIPKNGSITLADLNFQLLTVFHFERGSKKFPTTKLGI